MAMTREAYGQYLRGYATAAFKPLVLAGSRLTSVVEDVDLVEGFTVKLSAWHRSGSSYGPCPILIPIRAVEDNLAEQCIDEAIAQYRKAFPAPFPAPPEAESSKSHPVAQAIAALRPGASHIGGDRH